MLKHIVREAAGVAARADAAAVRGALQVGAHYGGVPDGRAQGAPPGLLPRMRERANGPVVLEPLAAGKYPAFNGGGLVGAAEEGGAGGEGKGRECPALCKLS